MKPQGFAICLGVGVLVLSTPPTAVPQSAVKVHRIGLFVGSPGPNSEAFLEELRELGYVEGRNVVIDSRSYEGRLERVAALAADLVRARPDVIVTAGTPLIQALQRETKTIPIIMASSADAVRTGLVQSLARPGGNVTGLTTLITELSGKRLQLLKEVVPGATRIAVLWNASGPAGALSLQETETAARNLGLTLLPIEIRSESDFENGFGAIMRGRAEAVFVIEGPLLGRHRAQVVELAVKHRLPTISPLGGFADAGGLVSYGPSLVAMWRRSAYFVDKILKGAKAADLPVEQPTKLELVVNLRTAKAIGLALPPSILTRADRAIE